MRESRRTMARRKPDSPAFPLLGMLIPDASSAPAGLIPADTGLAIQRGLADDHSTTLSPAPPAKAPRRTPARASAKRASSEPTADDRAGLARRPNRQPKSVPLSGPDFSIETARIELGARHVAGVDEVGRGPLAGPVVAAAVILDPFALPTGIDDSKKLDRAERERLFEAILAGGWVSVASASAAEIDRWNIRQATLLAMTRALAGLPHGPCHAIVDGRDVPASWTARGTAVVKGDARSLSIAAASIVAKVTRDRMMQRLCAAYPVYGFSRHMGYGTPEHSRALDRHGPCPYHRMTFSPIRQRLLDLV